MTSVGSRGAGFPHKNIIKKLVPLHFKTMIHAHIQTHTYMYILRYMCVSSGLRAGATPNKRIGQAWRQPVCHMFLLFGWGPYVSIVWRSAICFYCVALGHMFLLCGARPYVSIFSIKTIWSPLQWNRWLVT